MATRKHTMPAFLSESVSAEAYERWLTRKAAAHVKRDRKRSQSGVIQSLYKEAIHAAVVVSNGWGLLELRPLRMSLEEIFLHLTTEEMPHE